MGWLDGLSLNVKALIGTFNQERALVGAVSVIVKTSTMDRLQLLQ